MPGCLKYGLVSLFHIKPWQFWISSFFQQPGSYNNTPINSYKGMSNSLRFLVEWNGLIFEMFFRCRDWTLVWCQDFNIVGSQTVQQTASETASRPHLSESRTWGLIQQFLFRHWWLPVKNPTDLSNPLIFTLTPACGWQPKSVVLSEMC